MKKDTFDPYRANGRMFRHTPPPSPTLFLINPFPLPPLELANKITHTNAPAHRHKLK